VELKTAKGKQLRNVNRNLKTIGNHLGAFHENPLKEKDQAYVETITKVFEQQTYMRTNKTHSVPERIVSIHQPHVRPIVRGKEKAKVEFGSKINVSLVDGYSFLDHLLGALQRGRLSDTIGGVIQAAPRVLPCRGDG
jgi:hypothetical protein